MSVTTELTRIQQAKADIAKAIKYRGGTVPNNSLISDYYEYINTLNGYINYNPVQNAIVHNGLYHKTELDAIQGKPLWFKAAADSSSVTWYIKIAKTGSPASKAIQYSLTTTVDLLTNQPSFSSWSTLTENQYIAVRGNQYIGFRSNNTTAFSKNNSNYRTFSFSRSSSSETRLQFPIYSGGDVMSLMKGSYSLAGCPYCFFHLFMGQKDLCSAPQICATTLSEGCFEGMFNRTSIINPPILLAKTLAPRCYAGMFYGCTKLLVAPDLPALSFAANCYDDLFGGCYKIHRIKCSTYKNWDSTATRNWLAGLPYGLFITEHPEVFPSSEGGIPTNWDVTAHEYNMSNYTV